MDFYYVKSGGLATLDAGRAAVERTGSFAAMTTANYYDSLYDVFAGLVPSTAPVDGDIIFVSDAHAKDYTDATFSIGVNVSCVILAVQDSLCELYTNITDGSGAYEGMGSGAGSNEITLAISTSIVLTMHGVSYFSNTAGDLNLSAGLASSRFSFRDCEFKWATGTVSYLKVYGSSSVLAFFRNCKLTTYTYGSNKNIFLDNNTNHIYDSCVFDISTIFTHSSNGGGNVQAKSCDFSICPSPEALMIPSGLTTALEDGSYSLTNCLVPSDTWDLVNGSVVFGTMDIRLQGCHTADGYHVSRAKNFYGSMDTEESTVLGGSYDGTNKFATKLISSTEAEYSFPLRVELATVPAQDLRGDKTYTVEFTCDNELTDGDFAIELERPDGTTQALGVIQSTAMANILSTPVTHTTSTSSWTNPLTFTQKISETISGMAGVENGTVTVWLVLMKPNETVVIDTAVIIS